MLSELSGYTRRKFILSRRNSLDNLLVLFSSGYQCNFRYEDACLFHHSDSHLTMFSMTINGSAVQAEHVCIFSATLNLYTVKPV